MLKDVNSKEKFKLRYLLYLLFSFFIGLLLIFLENKLQINIVYNYNFCYLIFCGILMSIGVIVPGISSTIILMLLGIYSTYLYSVSNIYLPVLIPIAIGLVIGSFICMKITKILLNKYYSQTFYSIIGFTLGSILILWPGLNETTSTIISIFCIIIGICILNLFVTKKQ